jgi:hypothetical protein
MAGGTLVDSNVLLDILTEDPVWEDWSTNALADAAEAGPLCINPIVYAEVSIRFTTVEALEDALPPQDYRREPIPWAAAFLAGKGLPRLPTEQGHEVDDAAGLLHRCPRRGRRSRPADQRRRPVPDLLPDRGAHRPGFLTTAPEVHHQSHRV